jgi:hypothetical protein
VGFATPERAALAGDRTTTDTFVVTSATTENDAIVILMSPGWPGPDWVHVRRYEDGWEEGSSGDGHTIWIGNGDDDDDEVGVLTSWGDAPPSATSARVTFHGTTTEVPVGNGHWAWIVDGVREVDWDDPAEFEWRYEPAE